MKRYRQIAAFILAGGASSRMGRDKGLLDFGGVPLILHIARLLDPIVTKVTVVGSPGRYLPLGLDAIGDDPQGRGSFACGPLAGIATALAVTRSPWNLIVACDLPYLSTEWLDWLFSRALQSRAEAVVPRTERGIEPLAAVYRRDCSASVADALARGVRKVSDAIEGLDVEFVYPCEWQTIDPSELMLRNMNAPGDYEQARKWWASEHLRESEHVRNPLRTSKRKRQSAPRRHK